MQKIKQFIESEKGKDVLIVLIVILVGSGSFMLGRLSVKGNESSGVKIEYQDEKSGEYIDQTANIISSTKSTNNKSTYSVVQNPTGKNYFASNRGSKYYSLGCSAGKTIKQENRVYFSTAEAAQAAGYTLSGSCK